MCPNCVKQNVQIGSILGPNKKSQIEDTFGVQVFWVWFTLLYERSGPRDRLGFGVSFFVAFGLAFGLGIGPGFFSPEEGRRGGATRDGAQLMNGAPRPRSTTEGKTVPRAVGPVWEIPSCGPRVRSWRTVVRGNTRFLATPGQNSWRTFPDSNEERRLRGCCGGASSWRAVRPNLSLCLSSNHGRV